MHENFDQKEYVQLGQKYEDSVVRLDIIMPIKIHRVTVDASAHASGVIIDKNWILTTAHSLVQSKSVIVHFKDNEYDVEKIISHDKFDRTNGFYDIGLIKTKNLIENGKVLPFSEIEHTTEPVIICGFGNYTVANNLSKIGFDKKIRAGRNLISRSEDHIVLCYMVYENPIETQYISIHGDSGGPVLLNDEIYAINSCIIATDGVPDGSYGDYSGHTRVFLFRDWIREQTSK